MKCEYLSASGAEMYENCPLRFHARYELGLRSGSDDKIGAGMLTHKALEWYYNPSVRPTAEEAFKFASEREECRDQDMFEESRRMFNDVVAVEDRDSLNVIGTEVDFKLCTTGGAMARGFIDRLDMTGDNSIQVLDYKTGNYVPTMDELVVAHQSRLYPLWIFLNPDFSDIERVTVRYIYTKTCESKTLPPVTREKAMRYMEYLEHLYYAIRRCTRPQPVLNMFCFNCENRGDCPEYLNLMKVAYVLSTGADIPEGYEYRPCTFDETVELYDRLSKAESIIDREKRNTGMHLSSILKYNSMNGSVVNGKSVRLMSKKFRKCGKDDVAAIIRDHGLEKKAIERITASDMESIVKGNRAAMKALEKASSSSEGNPYPVIRKLKTKDGDNEQEAEDIAGQ